jgi:hypothetical protein
MKILIFTLINLAIFLFFLLLNYSSYNGKNLSKKESRNQKITDQKT